MATKPEVILKRPNALGKGAWDVWVRLQDISRVAYTAALTGTQDKEAIKSLVGGSDYLGFSRSHRNPNDEVGVGKRFYSNQVYTHTRLAIATIDRTIVGYGYSAHNASGGGGPSEEHNDSLMARLERRAKLMSIDFNYLWIRDIVVHPDFQGRGIANEIGRTLLEDGYGHQPVAAYTFPTDLPQVESKLLGLGFERTSEPEPNAFGIDMARYQADSVSGLLTKIR